MRLGLIHWSMLCVGALLTVSCGSKTDSPASRDGGGGLGDSNSPGGVVPGGSKITGCLVVFEETRFKDFQTRQPLLSQGFYVTSPEMEKVTCSSRTTINGSTAETRVSGYSTAIVHSGFRAETDVQVDEDDHALTLAIRRNTFEKAERDALAKALGAFQEAYLEEKSYRVVTGVPSLVVAGDRVAVESTIFKDENQESWTVGKTLLKVFFPSADLQRYRDFEKEYRAGRATLDVYLLTRGARENIVLLNRMGTVAAGSSLEIVDPVRVLPALWAQKRGAASQERGDFLKKVTDWLMAVNSAGGSSRDSSGAVAAQELAPMLQDLYSIWLANKVRLSHENSRETAAVLNFLAYFQAVSEQGKLTAPYQAKAIHLQTVTSDLLEALREAILLVEGASLTPSEEKIVYDLAQFLRERRVGGWQEAKQLGAALQFDPTRITSFVEIHDWLSDTTSGPRLSRIEAYGKAEEYVVRRALTLDGHEGLAELFAWYSDYSGPGLDRKGALEKAENAAFVLKIQAKQVPLLQDAFAWLTSYSGPRLDKKVASAKSESYVGLKGLTGPKLEALQAAFDGFKSQRLSPAEALDKAENEVFSE